MRYSVFSTTGHLINHHGGEFVEPVGSREHAHGPITTWYVWDEAQCETVCEHGSAPEANRCARFRNRWDTEDDPDTLRLLTTRIKAEHV